MRVKVSDYIAQLLVELGIDHNFTIPGGGAMHLNVSLGHQPGLKCVYVQHEQAASMAAEGYYRKSNKLPLVCCTTGPGGTNTLTGVLGSWLDSIPMLVISGQVKYSVTVRSTGYPIRIYGDQEFDITKVVAPMTKYAVMITEPRMVKYHIKRAIFLATTGRPGPVWLDIPLNVQWGYVDTDELIDYNPEEDANTLPREVSIRTLDLIIEKIKQAKRPVLYTGVEIRTNGAYEAFVKLAGKLNIPIVTSFDGMDLVTEDNPLYAGRAGDVATRYGNWAVQNADFVLSLGSRLGIRQVSYATETWARDAFVVMVYPDPLEITRPNIHVELPVRADLKQFAEALSNRIGTSMPIRKEWLDKCLDWRKKYPTVTEKQCNQQGLANVYCFIDELSKVTKPNIPIVTGNGSACVVGANAFKLKDGQRFIFNSGCATMGYDLPTSIGVCMANDNKETYCITGDGSIQMNLQELQTIVFHKLPIKILVINNGGYHSMRLTQRGLFKDYTVVGVGPESGDLSFPEMSRIAEAYRIPYMSASSNSELPEKLKAFVAQDGCAMFEVFVDSDQAFEPKPSAMKRADGSLFSPPLEDLAPFLPKEELERIMIIPTIDREF
jgi:acetolactate synthase-1/2/3 large subunit